MIRLNQSCCLYQSRRRAVAATSFVTPIMRPMLLALAVLAALAGPAAADVKLPAIFSDNCVLQCDSEAPVWGWAAPGEEVTVAVAGKSGKAVADKDGNWSVKLPALAAGGPHELTVSGKNTLKVANVLVGEVWLCSGQSNMNMPIDWGAWGKLGTPEFEKQMKAADFPQIRMFMVATQIAGQPAKDVVGEWKVCRPDMTMMKWSAVGYFFGRELHQELKVPVGLIKSAVGGTPVESWMSRAALVATQPEMQKTLENWDAGIAKSGPAVAEYKRQMEDWKVAADKAKAAGQKAPPEPKKPSMSPDNAWWPASLYQGMIKPLAPYAIRGVIWYQGESNSGKPQYLKLFPAMIENWRQDWGQAKLPFLFVQLANFQAVRTRTADAQTEPDESAGYAVVREAQRKTLALPHTGMAVIIDIGEARNIHPFNKEDVGRRLALWAKANVYGRTLVYSGPLYDSCEVKGQEVVLKFKHVGGGLVAKDGAELKGFVIAGADRKFVWAKAKVVGETVVVTSAEVAAPVAVRYDWADNPIGNFINKEGLPASPFATDDWTFEGLTVPAGKK